jgi:putative DNA primase/helicase
MALIDIQERLKLLGAGKETPRKVPLMIYSDARANSLGLPRASLINTQWRKDAKSLMLDNGIQLVALDNIASLAPGLDENSKKDWDPINQWLIDLRFSDITVALLHHENKAGGQRGTSAREDNIDSTISLVRPHDYRIEDGCRFIVKFKKNRISTKDISLLQDYEFKLINNDGYSEWAWTTVRRKNQIEILRMLDEGISQTEITGMLSIDKAYVSRVKSKAVKEGQLSNSGKLTDSGFALVNSRDDEDEI